MADKEEWTEVEAATSDNKEDKVEFEVEEEKSTQAKESPPPEPKEEKSPEELEGIETKGAQKRIRQLIKQRKDRDDQISQLLKQNEELTGRLSTREQEFNNINKLHLDANEKQLQQQQVQGTADPKAIEWSQNNDWFGQDRIMTAAALALDAELKEEGFDPSDPEFYNEIDNRIKEAFPHKFNSTVEKSSVQEQPSQPAQVVAGASRSTPTPGKVKLTKEDVRLANNWGIPLEQYAAEKAKVQNADGEYTAINM